MPLLEFNYFLCPRSFHPNLTPLPASNRTEKMVAKLYSHGTDGPTEATRLSDLSKPQGKPLSEKG